MNIKVGDDWYQRFFESEWINLAVQQFPPEYTQAQVDFVLDKCALTPGQAVLDLCCGHGRHSLELARRGCRVVGLDISEPSLALARQSASNEDLVEFVQGDMREIPYTGEFDAVINLYTAFGYLEDQTQDQRVLDAICRALQPGGRFLLDTLNHAWIMRHFEPRDWRELEDGAVMLEEREFDLQTGRSKAVWTFIHPGGQRGELRHSLRLYTLVEFIAMLTLAGLSFTEAWGNFEGEPLGLDTRRMIILAHKK